MLVCYSYYHFMAIIQDICVSCHPSEEQDFTAQMPLIMEVMHSH